MQIFEEEFVKNCPKLSQNYYDGDFRLFIFRKIPISTDRSYCDMLFVKHSCTDFRYDTV